MIDFKIKILSWVTIKAYFYSMLYLYINCIMGLYRLWCKNPIISLQLPAWGLLSSYISANFFTCTCPTHHNQNCNYRRLVCRPLQLLPHLRGLSNPRPDRERKQQLFQGPVPILGCSLFRLCFVCHSGVLVHVFYGCFYFAINKQRPLFSSSLCAPAFHFVSRLSLNVTGIRDSFVFSV